MPAVALDQAWWRRGGTLPPCRCTAHGPGPEQREEVRRILVRLVTAEGTRARRTAPELEAGTGPAAVALDALVGARLVVARQMEGESTFELVHEALLTGWGTLGEWLDSAADQRRLLQRLEGAAAEWERLGFSNEALWRGRQFMEASSLDRGSLGAREAAFLEHSRQQRRRQKAWRAMGFAATPLVLLVAILLAQLRARHQMDLEVDRQLLQARTTHSKSVTFAEQAKTTARDAFSLYDSGSRQAGAPVAAPSNWDRAEETWSRARELRELAEGGLVRASQMLEAALLLEPSRVDVRRLLAQATHQRIELGEVVDSRPPNAELVQRLRQHDATGEYVAEVEATGELSLHVQPTQTRVQLEAYRSHAGQLVPELVEETLVGTGYERALSPGSYRLILTAPGRAVVRYPFLVVHSEQLPIAIELPPASSVPAGFVYVPAGRFLSGEGGPEDLRRALNASPLHTANTGDFMIAARELTFGEWMSWLAQLPSKQARDLVPMAQSASGAVRVERSPSGWLLRLRPSGVEYIARAQGSISYAERRSHRDQRSSALPVSGISYAQLTSLLSQLPDGFRGLRVCTESEWERAARGADGRSYTIGERVEPDQANFDQTYARRPGGMGPDEVASHPESESPFGLSDAQGNAFEIVRSIHDDAELLEKGGSWYHDLGLSGRLSVRFPLESATRSVTLGVRLCRDAKGEP